MFRNIIAETSLTTQAADSLFKNSIPIAEFHGDVSWVSTLRALAYPRMKEDDQLVVRFVSRNYTKSNVDDSSDAVLSSVCRVFEEHANFIIVSLEGMSKDNEATMKLLEEEFCNVSKGWVRLQKVTDFYVKTFKVLCFINPDKKSVVLFVDNLDSRRLHYLQCGIFAMLPWYFDPKVGVDEEEMELIQSLRGKTSDKYLECIEKISKRYDFRTEYIKSSLKGFEAKYAEKSLESLKRKAENIMYEITRIKDRMTNQLKEKEENDIRMLGVMSMLDEKNDNNEIMDYFLCNKKLYLNETSDNTISFFVWEYITYFDEEMVESALRNKRSYIYRPDGIDCDRFISTEDAEALVRSIFIDGRLKLRACAEYSLEIGYCCRGISGTRYPAEFNNCIPNTHIDRYSCLGNYEMAINERILENDYLGAIEQCVASCKSLNFSDSTVMNLFFRNLYGMNDYKHNKCIELPDGNIVNAQDAVKWLKQEDNKDE